MKTAPAQHSPKPLPMLRKMIAQHMISSLSTTAQLTYFADADVTNMLEQRKAWKIQGHAIGIEDCVIAALSSTLQDYPAFNATLIDQEISVHADHNVSVALSTPTGLLTPVIRQAQTRALEDLAATRRDLVNRGRVGALKVSEMKGGTITLSNLGLTRVRHFTPILNAPQVALLGLGRIDQKVQMSAGAMESRAMMGLSLTADHQWLDGEPCGQFLGALCDRLETFDFQL